MRLRTSNLTTYRFHADDFKLLFQLFYAFLSQRLSIIPSQNAEKGLECATTYIKINYSSEIGKRARLNFAEPAKIAVCRTFWEFSMLRCYFHFSKFNFPQIRNNFDDKFRFKHNRVNSNQFWLNNHRHAQSMPLEFKMSEQLTQYLVCDIIKIWIFLVMCALFIVLDIISIIKNTH